MQPVRSVDHRLSVDDPRVVAFWRERHLCTLTTLFPDGRPHVVPVGATLDPAAGLARVITSAGTVKARNIAADGSPVALCQVDGRRWTTIEGTAFVRTSPAEVADAEARYAERYRPPRPNPERVVLEIAIDRIIGGV
ncbi:Pyridoxamine 5'-phosphate oxidase [Actinomadura rubteroloni]|uniref:Pyridoxamine 5'-phosphate oxidase n=1 Tax=Actinomadura rubteroloni TaxID=1926885 RepID=A0A2P4UNR6_9ACTN|nr:TIGR03618 family F420-dependent PPOX class oxidoreductase [Actinomadura rubteroloni]POM26687.1 Pyridoxamine 5'-phosphate oxidase [Actinomadura rubteroloni]